MIVDVRINQGGDDTLDADNSSLPATGACYWCGDDIAPGYLFCCGDCRQDWDKAQRMRRITGK